MNVFEFEPLTIPVGGSYRQKFNIVNKSQTSDYSKFSGVYLLSPYGFEDTNVLSIPLEKNGDSFVANINSNDTVDLEAGCYTVKLVFTDENGNVYKPARGILNLLRDSKTNEVI